MEVGRRSVHRTGPADAVRGGQSPPVLGQVLSAHRYGQIRSRDHHLPHRVLVGIDGSPGGDAALDWAAAEASRTGALLEIHTAYGTGGFLVTPKHVQSSMRGILEEAMRRAGKVAPGLDTVGVFHEGSPANALVEASEGAELLVVGSRGLGGFAGLMLGSVGLQCAVHARCPVVIVRPAAETANEPAGGPAQ